MKPYKQQFLLAVSECVVRTGGAGTVLIVTSGEKVLECSRKSEYGVAWRMCWNKYSEFIQGSPSYHLLACLAEGFLEHVAAGRETIPFQAGEPGFDAALIQGTKIYAAMSALPAGGFFELLAHEEGVAIGVH